MAIDETRHDPLPCGIDDLHVVSIAMGPILRKRPDALDTVTLNDHSLIGGRRVPCAVYQGAVLDDESMFALAPHIDLLCKRMALMG
jgi:hypothetical protein